MTEQEIDILQQEINLLRGAIQEIIRAKRDFEADVSAGVTPKEAKGRYENRMDQIMCDLDRVGAK
jgi:hypothetical protein